MRRNTGTDSTATSSSPRSSRVSHSRGAYKYKDSKSHIRGGYITQPLATTSKDDRPNLRYAIKHEGVEIWPEKQWIWEKDRLETAYRHDEVVINERDGKYSVRMKQYLRDENGVERLGKPVSLLNGPFNQEGTKEIRGLFGSPIFDFPKPSALIRYLFSFVINDQPREQWSVSRFLRGVVSIRSRGSVSECCRRRQATLHHGAVA